MSYLAIARKYRPSTFDEIVGQEHVTRTLRNAIESDRIHHAFLFCGARGVGKTTAARALARALNCVNGPTVTPCGECKSCNEIGIGNSEDLIEIDGASNNSVDDIRQLRDTVHYPPNGRYKIYLVDEVHMLSKAAFNALLKTLEEPPPSVVFIFATTEPNKILDTILSRVQRFDFKRIGTQAVVDRLRDIATAEGASLSDEALKRIARAGEGSMRDAQSLLDKVISFGGGGQIPDETVYDTLGLIDRGLLFAMLEGLVHGEPEPCLDSIAQVYAFGFELSQFTGELLEILRNATLVALSPGSQKYVDAPPDELQRLAEIVDGVEAEALSRLFSAVLEVHDQVSRAARPRIVLEMAVARLASTRKVQPVGKLLGRLEALERQIRQGGGTPGPGGLGGNRSRGNRGGSRSGRPSGYRAAPLQRRTPEATTPSGPDAAPEPPKPEPAPVQAPPRTPDAPQVLFNDEPPPPDAPWEERFDTSSAWPKLQAAWRKLGGGAEVLAQGRPEFDGNRLTVRLPAGRMLSRGARAARSRSTRDAVERLYGPGVRLGAEMLPGTGTAQDELKLLERKILEDPGVKRVLDTLGAELERVTPLDDSQPGDDA